LILDGTASQRVALDVDARDRAVLDLLAGDQLLRGRDGRLANGRTAQRTQSATNATTIAADGRRGRTLPNI
jgi:hypothetical protein